MDSNELSSTLKTLYDEFMEQYADWTEVVCRYATADKEQTRRHCQDFVKTVGLYYGVFVYYVEAHKPGRSLRVFRGFAGLVLSVGSSKYSKLREYVYIDSSSPQELIECRDRLTKAADTLMLFLTKHDDKLARELLLG